MSYLLGVSRDEVRRLDFQEGVWGFMSRALWDRLGVRSPWRCLDVGAGVGSATVPLARRVLPGGRVVALEPSAGYTRVLRRRAPANVQVVEATLDRFEWDGPPFDFVFCRWLFLFIRDLKPALARLARLLRPGGFLAVQDYHDYDGMTLYPESPAFNRVIAGARRWFLRNGGDLRVAGRLPAAFRRLGLRMVDFRPSVLAGDGRSAVFRWAGRFFLKHLPAMVASGAVSAQVARGFRADWRRAARRRDGYFVSPIVFDVVSRKPLVKQRSN
jgi:SAM-dependent methyltransferase